MQKNIIYFIYICITACSFLPKSEGKENEIIIVTSAEDKPYVEHIIENLFSHIIHTPQPEFEYSLKYKNPWEFDSINKNGNILIVSLEYPEDSTGDFLMKRFANKNKIDESVFILEDVYSKSQLICGIQSQDAISMGKDMIKNGDWIKNEIRNMIEYRMTVEIYKHGKNPPLSKKMLKYFGATLDLQPDYVIIKEDSLKPFLWIGRAYPYRWISVHKSYKEKYIAKNKVFDHYRTDMSELIPDIKISEHFQNLEYSQNGLKKHPIIRGLYEHENSESGGPFFVYIFETESVNEVILVSGFVNYPGRDKILLLKQLELIAKTLNKGESYK